MKKLILTAFAVVAGATFVHAQGILELNSGTVFNVTTNTGTFGNTTVPDAPYGSIISGKTSTSGTAAFGFYYTYLFIPTGVGTSGDLASLSTGNWEQLAQDNSGTVGAGILGTNVAVAGNWGGQSGTAGQSSIGISGDAFNSGTTYSIALVGWSANLGSSWSTVYADYSTGNWNLAPGTDGNFGFKVATVNPASGGVGNSPTSIFGNGSLVLYTVPVPEPTTLALAGLGGLSMLFLRRRKA